MKQRLLSLLLLRVFSTIILFVAFPVHAEDIVVTTTADVVDGDVSSISALLTNPGPDGISLREAILAVNNTTGFHTITFSSKLDRQTIMLTNPLPPITRDQVTIKGFSDAHGEPAITIDAGESFRGGFVTWASDFTVTHLRIIGLRGGGWPGVKVWMSMALGQVVPLVTMNIRIEDNVFEGGDDFGMGVSIGMDFDAAFAVIRNVVIARNTFFHVKGGDGIHVAAHGTNGLIENVNIHDNIFSETTFPVELVSIGSNNRISNTKIMRNLFVNNEQPVSINHIWNEGTPPALGSTIEDTLIFNNVFRDNENPAFAILGGMYAMALNNVILNTQIVNNLITGTRRYGAIGIVGGRNGANGNRVDGIQIANNTIANNPMVDPFGGPAIGAVANIEAAGNSVTGVTVINTVLWDNTEGDFSGLTPDQVHFCITSQEDFAGVNGNISADPKFINPAAGDFHLQAGSPAIDAGTSQGTPETDLEGHVRFDDPATANTGGGEIPYYDIGCFEYHSPNVVSLTITKEGTGNGAVTSSPAGIDCGQDCSAYYGIGTEVTLATMPDAGSVFTGWSGDECSGPGECAITMDQDKRITAIFAKFPIILHSPPDKVILNACSLDSLPVFGWTPGELFKRYEIQFSADENFGSKMVMVKAKVPSGISQAAISLSAWKKIFMLPGTAGGEVYWRIVGTRSDKTTGTSNVYSLVIGAPYEATNADIRPVSTGSLPTLSWENKCNKKFKVWFGNNPDFTKSGIKKKSFSFSVSNPGDNGGVFSKELSLGQWRSIRKLVGNFSGSTIYWYVESWDGLKRYSRTGVFNFALTE